MTAQHDMTEDDLRNFLEMNRDKTTVSGDKVMPNVIGIYFAGGLVAIIYLLDLNMVQCLAIIAFTFGFAWLFTLNTKRSAKLQLGRSIRQVGGPRTYTIGDGILETQTSDSRVWTQLDRITDLRSNARGTLVCLGEAHPLYLPFGGDYRPDFIVALRAALPKGVGAPPPLAR